MRTKSLFLMLLTIIFVTSACKKDPCKDLDCGTQGYCIDGSCACNSGWLFDSDGKCNEQDLCLGKVCSNGNCNPQTGQCDCIGGWSKDANGQCTIQDVCYQVDCGTYGNCEPYLGSYYCECDLGYGYDSDGKCNIELRTLFTGTWTGTHIVNNQVVGPYTITISNVASDKSQVYIDNFWNYTCNSQSQPLRAIGYFYLQQSFDNIVTTCSELSYSHGNAILATSNDLTMTGFIQDNGYSHYLEGNYVRQ